MKKNTTTRKAISIINIIAGALTFAMLFGACNNGTTTEIVPQRPTFKQLFVFHTSVDETTKDRFIAAYGTLDTDYLVF